MHYKCTGVGNTVNNTNHRLQKECTSLNPTCENSSKDTRQRWGNRPEVSERRSLRNSDPCRQHARVRPGHVGVVRARCTTLHLRASSREEEEVWRAGRMPEEGGARGRGVQEVSGEKRRKQEQRSLAAGSDPQPWPLTSPSISLTTCTTSDTTQMCTRQQLTRTNPHMHVHTQVSMQFFFPK